MLFTRIVVASVLLAAPRIAFAQEPTVLKHDGWVAAVAFAPDGKTLASAGADNVVRLWEVGTWKPKGVLKGHTDCVCALGFSRKGGWLASGSYDATARIWEYETMREHRTLKHKGVVLSVHVTNFSNGPYVLSGSLDGAIHHWPPFGDKRSIPAHRSWINSLADHENQPVASGSSDGTVRVGALDIVKIFEGGAGEVRCVALRPDGKTLAAGNRYGTVRIWNVESRKEIKTLTGHMGDVWAIAFSPDGKTLAAVDTDWKKPSKIKLYDTATWKERGSLPCPGEILCLAYSPKGDWLAAGSWDKTVRLFKIEK